MTTAAQFLIENDLTYLLDHFDNAARDARMKRGDNDIVVFVVTRPNQTAKLWGNTRVKMGELIAAALPNAAGALQNMKIKLPVTHVWIAIWHGEVLSTFPWRLENKAPNDYTGIIN